MSAITQGISRCRWRSFFSFSSVKPPTAAAFPPTYFGRNLAYRNVRGLMVRPILFYLRTRHTTPPGLLGAAYCILTTELSLPTDPSLFISFVIEISFAFWLAMAHGEHADDPVCILSKWWSILGIDTSKHFLLLYCWLNHKSGAYYKGHR